MKQYKVRITRQAREHLREIYRHISQELMAPAAAENTLAKLYKEIRSLDQMPKRIHLTPEPKWNEQGIRRMLVKNYYVYFWVDEGNARVQVTGIIYVKRDQARQLENMDME